MIRSSVEKLAGEIGFDIGMGDNVTQANLLNGFGSALHKLGDDLDNQLVYIVQELDGKTIEVLTNMVEFCKLKGGQL